LVAIQHSIDGTFALRTERFKLIPSIGSHGFWIPRRPKPLPGATKGQLYDMRKDPGESKTLWLERPGLVKRMLAELERLKSN